MNWWNYSILKERITIKTSEKQNKPIVDEHQQSSLIQYDEYNAIYSSTERENPDFSRRGVVAKRGEVTACRNREKAERTMTRLSKKERRVDALALRADERRDKLRKAAGRCK